MKKIYVLLMLLPLFSLKAQVPTCSLNPTFIHNHGEGIWPDSALNFVSGTVGVPYQQNITINVPLDTTVGAFTFTYSYFELATPSSGNYGLPPGLSLACTAHPNWQFPGNDSTCMIIYGTPTTAGTYALTFTVNVYCTSIPGTALSTKTLNYYKIKINAATGIETNNNYDFQVMQNSPNPVVGNITNVKFTTPADGKAKMTVYNITGQKIADKDILVQRGDNNYDFDAATLENGLYLYSVEFNGQKQIRRMVVAK